MSKVYQQGDGRQYGGMPNQGGEAGTSYTGPQADEVD